jgi:hypothetical protein
MTRRLPIIAATAAALLLSACSGGGQAVTVGEAPETTHSAAPVEQGVKRQLTEDEALAALPTIEQIGAGWAEGKAGEGESSGEEPEPATFSPEQCNFAVAGGDVSGLQPVDSELKPVAEVQAEFHLPGESAFDVQGAAVKIASYAEGIDTSKIEAIASRLEECSEFTSTSSDGVTSKMEIFPLSLPNYGDKTLAFRLQGSVGMFVIIADAVQIVAGHNLVTVAQFGLGKIDTELAARAAAAVMENLDEVTAKS